MITLSYAALAAIMFVSNLTVLGIAWWWHKHKSYILFREIQQYRRTLERERDESTAARHKVQRIREIVK